MGPFSHPGVPRLLLAIAVVAAALALHIALWRLILRVMRDRAFAEELQRYCRWPARAVVVLGAVLLVFSATRPRPTVRGAAFDALLLGLIAAARTVVLRALVSANTAPDAWDLRCEIRERLVAWLQREQPQALPRLRAELQNGPDGRIAPPPTGNPSPRDG